MKLDTLVIGSGPGGYVAAIRCAQLGQKTGMVEKHTTKGGTCLNVGCIPSKALLDSSEHFHNAYKHFKTHGIDMSELKLNWPQMVSRKDKVVEETCGGIDFLMKKNKIKTFEGYASFIGTNQIQVLLKDGGKIVIEAKNTIIATGSKPSSIPNINIDKDRIISSTEALKLKEVPQNMIIIGGGVIGLELGSVYARLGTKINVIEYLDRIIPTMDSTLSNELQRSLKKLGFKFYLKHKVLQVISDSKSTQVEAKNQKGDTVSFDGDYCLVSVGRKPYTENLGLEKMGVVLSKEGFIEVNKNLETNVPGIYAIGDVIGGAMLAHKAEEEGTFVAEYLDGQKPHINYNAIPAVVYTWPEVAGVGYTEESLQEQGIKFKMGSFHFRALGRARAAMELDGLVKVLADANTDEILGIHMIGARAADMIAEAVVALEYRASAEDIARMSHAHPTFTEAMKEACLAATANRAIHS